nr:MAG TPA: hypothetical protein [Caudoviricetes sp.]
MKTIYPEFEGNELFINSNVKSTDPYGFLGNRDVLWVDISVQEMLELVYEADLISEDKYLEYKDEEDRTISYEVLDGILELDELVEDRLIEKFSAKLLNEYNEEINNFGGLRVLFDSGDEVIIKAGKENEDEFI